MSQFDLFNGDSLEVLKQFPDNFIDSIVTDPPYGLSFMGKKWDYDVPSVDIWREVLRVLKPGGYLLSFGGTRTYHRMVVNIEDAGFEIRDQIQWLYGCYSEDTECFTRQGWAKYDQVTLETEVLQWNSETNEMTWTKPLKIISKPYSGPMVHLQNRHTDQLLTPNHRVYAKIQKHSRNESAQNYEVIEAGDLKSHWLKTLPLAGDLNEGAQSKSLAYLLGWWMTDAWVHGDGKAAMFSQSKPDTMLKLRTALEAVDAKFSEYVKKAKKDTHQDEHTFYVTGDLAKYLIGEYPKREFGYECLSWDMASRVEFLKGLIDGDGSQDRVDQYGSVFWSKKIERLEIVQALALTLGYRTLIDAEKGCVHLNPARNSTQLQSKHTLENVDYSGIVWCLQVPEGAFLVRRNGQPFISGNSGFPKSHDVSKAIDKAAGAEREVLGLNPSQIGRKTANHQSFVNTEEFDGAGEVAGQRRSFLTAPSTPEAKQWQGWGSALKPANEPIVLARKPLEKGLTIAENVLKWGCGGLNIDASRIEGAHTYTPRLTENSNLNDDGWNKIGVPAAPVTTQGRFPANLLLNETAAEMLDEQSGPTSKTGKRSERSKLNNLDSGNPFNAKGNFKDNEYTDSGGASRFFYVAKASKRERGEGNVHPTVKPIKLMEYLIMLITPPGGIVLDPFMGSGTTGVAAVKLEFNFLGIERELEYVQIAEKRIGNIQAIDTSEIEEVVEGVEA